MSDVNETSDSTEIAEVENPWPIMFTRQEIKDRLSRSIKGQDEAVSLLSYLGNLYLLQLDAIKNGIRRTSMPRLNLLISGSTGGGKTVLAKKFAESLDMPYFRIDCSATKAEGWHGTNLSDQIHNYLELSEYGLGVLHFDEVDKLADTGGEYRYKMELQSNMLDLLQGEYHHVYSKPNRDQVYLSNVNNALIILSGSFQFQRNEKTIGFIKETVTDYKDKLSQMGFIQEFEARILHSIELNPNTADTIYDIITKSEESAYKKYLNFLGPKYELSPKVLKNLSQQLGKSKNGLRDLETNLFKLYYEKNKI